MSTFDELLFQLEAADDELDTLKADTLVTDIANKIDAIKHVTEKLENYIEFLEHQIEPLDQARKSAKNNLAALKASLTASLQNHGVDEFPGVVWRLSLQDSPAAVEYSRAIPTSHDFLSYPEKVERRVTYSWKTDEIKQALKDGNEFEFAKLKHGKHVRFYLKKPFKRAIKTDHPQLEPANDPAKFLKPKPTF
jgi:chaperonin cofactor prefoldin